MAQLRASIFSPVTWDNSLWGCQGQKRIQSDKPDVAPRTQEALNIHWCLFQRTPELGGGGQLKVEKEGCSSPCPWVQIRALPAPRSVPLDEKCHLFVPQFPHQ